MKNITFDYLPCKVYGIDVKGMIDTGANVSIISETFVRKHKLDRLMEKTARTITLANGNDSFVIGILYQAPLSLDDSFNIIVDLMVTKACSYDFIFGRNL